MTTLTFPSSPTSGQIYNAPNGVVYTYTDGKWVGSTSSSSSLPTQSGNTGKYLTTDGSFTSWASVSASPGGSDTQIQFNDNGSFGGNGNLTFNKTTGQVHIGATTSSAISDGYNGALVLEGGIGAKGNIHMLHGIVHNQLYVGNNAGSTTFDNPTLIIKDTGINYLQAAVVNANGDASADWVVYGDNGDDTQAWSDMGFAGSTFNDANYTITAPNDGYFFVEGSGGLGGNMVLATGAQSGYGDIIFATGGFLSTNETMRLRNSDKTLAILGNILSQNANLGNVVQGNYFIGSGNNLSNIQGSNITGAVSYATTANSVAWGNISSKPTTISGYGITDAYSNSNVSSYLPTYAGNITGGNLSLTGSFQGLTPSYTFVDDSASASWWLLGTWNTVQNGQTLYMKIISHQGYNGVASQNQVTELIWAASNGTSTYNGATGAMYAAGNATINSRLGTGNITYQAPSKFRVVQVSSSQYQVYGYFGAYTRGSTYSVQTSNLCSWVHSGTPVSTPGGNYLEFTPTTY